MYSPINKLNCYQGDIIKDFLFISLPVGKPKVIEKIAANSYKILDFTIPETEKEAGEQIVAVNAFVADAMIISQTCDIQLRDYIQLCPIFNLEHLKQELQNKGYDNDRLNSNIKLLGEDKINYYFHLQEYKSESLNLEESYVDLVIHGIMPVSNIKDYKRILALSDLGRQRLAYKLINFYGRPAY